MKFAAVLGRIRAKIRRKMHRNAAMPRLESWEEFDLNGLGELLEELSREAQEDAEQLSEALRNRN